MAAVCSTSFAGRHGHAVSRVVSGAEGYAMRLGVYGAVLVIALGGVLLGLDWLSAPMSPMVNTEAGLRAAAPPRSYPGAARGNAGNCTAESDHWRADCFAQPGAEGSNCTGYAQR